MSVDSLRREYRGQPLSEDEAAADPFEQFARWFEQARATEADPTAMTLATATPDGRPSARMVLLKGVDARGFVFYTNYDSRKAGELDGTHRAALLFYWPLLDRQVRIEGDVRRVPDAESDAYFASRPLESRWSAHASPQSRAIDSRASLEAAVDRARAQFGDQVPRPAGWGGFRVAPDAFEFWQGRENRLHDRLAYSLGAGTWRRARLAP
jgi:pyridoxamine 5'-phosphate oxidase